MKQKCMTLNSTEVQSKLSEWQMELRRMTGRNDIVVKAFEPPRLLRPINEVVEVVCEETGITLTSVQKKTRKREVVIARQLIAYYGKICSGLTFKVLGQIIGGRDHTTVMHSKRAIQDLLETGNPAVCDAVARINKRLEQKAENNSA